MLTLRDSSDFRREQEQVLEMAHLDAVSHAELLEPITSEHTEVKPMNGAELGRRLGRDGSQPSRWKREPEELARRTRELDPDGLAWRYDEESKLFYPISE